MPLIAVLDKNNALVGYKKKTKPSTIDVVVDDECDLSDDGSYKWDADSGAFVPLGHGFGRPKSSPISNDRVLYLIASHLGDSIPQELRDWIKWYEENLKRREEEQNRKRK